MKKVLVTGSTGRIGSSIVEAFKADYDVLGIDINPGDNTNIIGDVLNIDLMRELIKDCDGVVHTAAYHAPHVGKVSINEFKKLNVEATKNIANICVDLGVKKLVFTSTTALYGHANQIDGKASWIDENVTPKPKTIYHETKLEAESFLESLCSSNDIKISVIRMSRCFPEPANQMALYRLHRGVDQRDVATAHKLAYESNIDSKFNKFIISGISPFEKGDCIELLNNPSKVVRKRASNLDKIFNELKFDYPNEIDRVYDSTKAQKELNWIPKFGYEEVIKQFKSKSEEVLAPNIEVNNEV